MTTDITELAQRMKAAAEKLDADQWQTRKGFSGIEVIVKGSLEKGTGCVSFQPVAAEIADTKTARAIALFNPANILALVEALEKAQTKNELVAGGIAVAEKLHERIAYLEKRLKGTEESLIASTDMVAELESRTVKLPADRSAESEVSDYDGTEFYRAGWNARGKADKEALTTHGIKWEAE